MPAHYDDLTTQLAALATGRTPDDARRLLDAERKRPGSTVSADLARRGVVPHVWSPGLLAFYADSDAFVFELAIWNTRRFKRSMRAWSRRFLDAERTRLGRPLRVLCHGDGLGVDAAAFAADGHDVSYFEFPGPTKRFAHAFFKRQGVDVTLLDDEHDGDNFDAVTCFDVLEHVPDVRSHVRSLTNRLRKGEVGGILLAHAPFYLVGPAYPTHLEANRRYSGRVRIYEDAGLGVVGGNALWNPLALRLGAKGGTMSWRLRAAGAVFSAGRVVRRPQLWAARFAR